MDGNINGNVFLFCRKKEEKRRKKEEKLVKKWEKQMTVTDAEEMVGTL